MIILQCWHRREYIEQFQVSIAYLSALGGYERQFISSLSHFVKRKGGLWEKDVVKSIYSNHGKLYGVRFIRAPFSILKQAKISTLNSLFFEFEPSPCEEKSRCIKNQNVQKQNQIVSKTPFT